MRVEIEGRNLPGPTWCEDPATSEQHEIFVGIGSKGQGVELVSGGADDAHWAIEVDLVTRPDGTLDFTGPFVDGPKGDRFVYLNWGTVAADGTFEMFRRAKLGLSELDPALVARFARASSRPAALRCTLDLTDAKGGPRCARVRPPDLTWQAI